MADKAAFHAAESQQQAPRRPPYAGDAPSCHILSAAFYAADPVPLSL